MSAALKGTSPAQFGINPRFIKTSTFFAAWGVFLTGIVALGTVPLKSMFGKNPRWIMYSDRVPAQKVIDEAKVNKWSW